MSTAFRVGLLVFLALIFLSIGVFLIGNKDSLFARTYNLKADFENVQGLNNGAEVRIGGMHEGTVEQIELPSQPGGRVTVVMKLRSATRNVIRRDSRVSIKTEGLLGDKYVEISFGTSKGQAIENNDTIASEAPEDMTQQAQELADEARQGVSAFRDDMDALQHNFLLRGFFEKRGYNDSSELTEHAIAHVPKEKPVKEFDYDPHDMFDKPDNAKLKNSGKLDDAGKYLQENPFGLSVIEASEAKGDSNKDRVLTEARANVVRDYLVKKFTIDDKRVETIGLGKTRAEDEPSKLVILIYAAGKPPEQARTASSSDPQVSKE